MLRKQISFRRVIGQLQNNPKGFPYYADKYIIGGEEHPGKQKESNMDNKETIQNDYDLNRCKRWGTPKIERLLNAFADSTSPHPEIEKDNDNFICVLLAVLSSR